MEVEVDSPSLTVRVRSLWTVSNTELSYYWHPWRFVFTLCVTELHTLPVCCSPPPCSTAVSTPCASAATCQGLTTRLLQPDPAQPFQHYPVLSSRAPTRGTTAELTSHYPNLRLSSDQRSKTKRTGWKGGGGAETETHAWLEHKVVNCVNIGGFLLYRPHHSTPF